MAYVAFVVLLALAWLLRRHSSVILSAMFGAVLLSTAVAGSLEPYTEVREIDNTAAGGAAGTAAHGILLHLMLDEHAGIMGIPKDVPGGEALRRDLRDFFAANGFRLFGNAISEYAATRNSMAGILNFTAGPTPYDFYEGRKPFVLQQSRSEEHTSELQSLMRISYAVFCLKKKKITQYRL